MKGNFIGIAPTIKESCCKIHEVLVRRSGNAAWSGLVDGYSGPVRLVKTAQLGEALEVFL